MNKYEREPDKIIDLHGHTTKEAEDVLDELVSVREFKHVRLITGKGTFRDSGPVLREFVKSYLRRHEIRFETAKLYNGGDGALEVYFG